MRGYLERVLRIAEPHYGPDHPHVAKTLTNLGNAYGDLGDAAWRTRQGGADTKSSWLAVTRAWASNT
eukprot:1382031-Amphidinium_carterae.1